MTETKDTAVKIACRNVWKFYGGTPAQYFDGATGPARREAASMVEQVRADGATPCEHVEGLLHDKLAEVDDRIAELGELRNELIELLDRSARLDPADCGAADVCHILNR